MTDQQRRKLSLSDLILFIQRRDNRTLPDAISHTLSIGDWDRRRLEKSILANRKQKCATQSFE